MSQQVEYKYVTSRNIVVNHAFETKGGGEWEPKQLGQSIITTNSNTIWEFPIWKFLKLPETSWKEMM